MFTGNRVKQTMTPVLGALALAAAATLGLCGIALAQPGPEQNWRGEGGAEHRLGEVLLAFHPGVPPGRANAVRKALGATKIKDFPRIGVHHWQLPPELSVAEAVKKLRGNPDVKYAEPNYLVQMAAQNFPNDPRLDDLWGMCNTGQTGGTSDADIDAPEAWDIFTGSGDIVVAVIDTGIDYDHEDLVNRLWTNPGEIPGNGEDDDLNGFIDDVHGYNFLYKNGDPFDDNDHGTHTSGTIGAEGNNGIGVVGVNWNVRIMALKFLDAYGWGSTADAVDAVLYATMMHEAGVNVVLTSNSWGGGGYSEALEDAIRASGEAGMLFIAAAGNSGRNTNYNSYYPACYDMDNVISVAATDHDDARASFSNYGSRTVDLGAPGVDVLSTIARDKYDWFNGTSMAAPHVAGVAALAWDLSPGAPYQMIRDAIFDGVDQVGSMSGKTVTGGRLNAFNTLDLLGMVVVGSSPAKGEVVGSPPTDFVIHFANPYEASTVQASDLTVKFEETPVEADAVFLDGECPDCDEDTVMFRFTSSQPVTNEGPYTMQMAAGSVTAAASGTPVPNDPLKAWSAVFYYDTVPLEATFTEPANGIIELPFAIPTLTATFNEPCDDGTVGVDDLVFSQWWVTVTGASYSEVSCPDGFCGVVDYTLGVAPYGVVSEGDLTVEMPAGAVTDIFGNANADSHQREFELDFGADPAVPLPVPLYVETPTGAMIYARPISGSIRDALDVDSFTIDVDPGQTITLVVDPDETLQPSVELSGPGVGASADAGAPGEDAVIQTAGLTTGGAYTITVSGWGTTGAYELQVILNAAVETEPNGGIGDAAQNIEPSFIELLPDGAQRGGVIGDIEDNGCSDPDGFGYKACPVDFPNPFVDISTTGTAELVGVDDGTVILGKGKRKLSGFEFNFYGTAYDELHVSSNGLITFESKNDEYVNANLYSSPEQAAIAPFWDDLNDDDTTVAAAVYWELQGSKLIIQWDNVRFYGGATMGEITFQAILDANDDSIQFNYPDLDSLHGGAGGAGATVGIKDAGTQGSGGNRLLLCYDSGPNRYVGDLQSTRIAVTGAPAVETPDFYAFNLDAGQSATLAMTAYYDSNETLELWNSSGKIDVEVLTGKTNVNQVIENFEAPADGEYYARVTGDTRMNYRLVVTRDATFDLENNSGPEPWNGTDPAQSLDISGGHAVVLGGIWSTWSDDTTTVLYFRDEGHCDPFAQALANLEITPTVAASYDDFVDKLQAGGWDLVILLCQNDANTVWVNPMVAWVDAGGRAILTDWTRNETVAAAFGATYSGVTNGDSIAQTPGHPIWEGVADPLALTDPGWNVFSMGLTATGGAPVGRFANGDAALIVGNGGRTVLNGFLSDAAGDGAVTIAENQITDTDPVLVDPDFYEITLAEGETLNMVTDTPADGDGEFVNNLDPMLELYNSSPGDPPETVASNEDCDGGDGHNACLTYVVQTGEGGTYYIAIFGEAPDPPNGTGTTGGAYVLTVDVFVGQPCGGNEDCDDGEFCNGTETCDLQTGTCQPGTAVVCDDGVSCTDDSCNEGTDSCDYVPNDANCDNGLYCDGVETCDLILDCQTGTAVDCNDNVGCTDDSCNEGTDSCDNVPNDANCDNGLFCDGAETCDSLLDCQAGSNPCPEQECDEDQDKCIECYTDPDCDDGLYCNGVETCVSGTCQAGTPVDCDDNITCTDDSCNEQSHSCDNVPNNANCDNGLFCDGAETCDSLLDCQPGSDPCPGQLCDEVTDTCVECLFDGDCDDGLFCNGAETCVSGSCQAGSDPCPGQECDEVNDRCVVDCYPKGHTCDIDADCCSNRCHRGTCK